jgi:chromosomal replication initiation ATPase DnaA
MGVQLGFPLPPSDPYSMHYLVVHSGIAEAVLMLEEAVNASSEFSLVVVWGESGSGKTHLLSAYKKLAAEKNISSEKIQVIELERADYNDEGRIAQFISVYEKLKSTGGVLFVSLQDHPGGAEINPHLKSRLLAGKIAALERPREQELSTVFTSLLQKKNMKLGERSIDFLLRRIPANTLSFEAISARLDEVFREDGREAKFSVVREMISTPEEEKGS